MLNRHIRRVEESRWRPSRTAHCSTHAEAPFRAIVTRVNQTLINPIPLARTNGSPSSNRSYAYSIKRLSVSELGPLGPGTRIRHRAEEPTSPQGEPRRGHRHPLRARRRDEARRAPAFGPKPAAIGLSALEVDGRSRSRLVRHRLLPAILSAANAGGTGYHARVLPVSLVPDARLWPCEIPPPVGAGGPASVPAYVGRREPRRDLAEAW
jgi:hypothetical protein